MSSGFMETKLYKVRAGRVPQVNPYLSGVVQVLDNKGKGYAYIRFSPDLVTALGRKMPRGIPLDHPAFFKLMWMPTIQVWRLYCLYFKPPQDGIMLEEYNELPEWVKIRRP